MTHTLILPPDIFREVRAGRRTFDLRPLDDRRRLIEVGDTLEFTLRRDRSQTFAAEVTELRAVSDPEELAALRIDSPGPWLYIGFRVLWDGAATHSDLSRYLCLILRHEPWRAGVTLDEEGWADTRQLLEGVSRTHPITMETLEDIVARDDKRRYSFNNDHTRIRTNYGHSIPLKFKREPKEPPETLWHGTGAGTVERIEREGLRPMSRTSVYLSPDPRTAAQVGSRHGRPVVLRVASGQMYRDGYRFYLTPGDTWLTQYVPPCYISRDQP